MKQAQTTLTIDCRGRGMTNFTPSLQAWIADTGIRKGQVTLFVQHTSIYKGYKKMPTLMCSPIWKHLCLNLCKMVIHPFCIGMKVRTYG